MIDLLKYFSLAPASAAIVLVVLWLFRNWISLRLNESVRHEYNAKLELLRNEYAQTKSRIDNLQSGALGNLALRENLLFERRLEAVEKLWGSKCILSKALMPVQVASMMNWDIIRKEVAKQGKEAEALKGIGELFTGMTSVKELLGADGVNVQVYKPYVPKDLWNYYGAYSGICLNAVLKFDNLKNGFGFDFFNENPYNEQLKEIFPELSEHINDQGEAAYSALLSLLSEKIIESIQNFHSGIEADEIAVRKAQKILDVVNNVNGPEVTVNS